jgi:hypothetical protein
MNAVDRCRVIREDVRAYCAELKLGEAQTNAAIDTALIAHSVAAGKRTADRLLQKLRAREARNKLFA